MLNDALFAIKTLLEMDARDSSVTHLKTFCSQETYNLVYSSVYIFFVATTTKTELALIIIAFGTLVMAYSR